MKRTLAWLLSLLILLPLIAACGTDTSQTATTTTASGDVGESTSSPSPETAETTAAIDSPYDEKGYLLDDLPDDLAFGGKTVTMLVWEDVENPEFEIKEQTGDMVNDAIYLRNQTVEERLGVTLEFIGTPGNYGNQASFLAKAQSYQLSGEPLDIMAAYSLTATSLVANHLTYDLADLKYLDFEKPWWPAKLVEEATIGDSVYFCAGDLSTNMLHKMHAVFVNKDILATNGTQMDDLYRETLDGKWTIDRMIELTKDVHADLNNNGKEDNTDAFGMVLCDNYFDVFFYGSGLRTIERDASGTPILSSSFGSEKTVELADKIGNYFANNAGAHFVTDFTEGRFMMNGNTMMIISRVDAAYKNLHTVENLDYGILPVPKYDATQKEYIGCLAFPCTLYTVSLSSTDPEMAGAVLECMGSEGYRQLTPALFEATMKLKYANDEMTSQVYDMIRSSVSFDLGRMFASSFNNNTYSIFRSACSSNSGAFMSQFTASKRVMEKQLSTLLEKIK